MLEASLVILNANVVTLNPGQSRAEAIAVQNGKIVDVGSNEKIRRHLVSSTIVIDAENRTVIPGLVDCHAHMTGFGRFLQALDLRNVESIGKLQRKLKEHSRKNPERDWILGRGWDQDKFAEKRYPNRWDLDAAVAEKPVFLTRVCGHAGVANSKALQLARITEETQVEGGRIDSDRTTGKPSGILRENALELIRKAIPRPSPEELEEACTLACQKAVEAGLTSVHWIVDSAEEIRAIQKLHFNDKIPLRICLGTPVDLLDELVDLGLLTGFGNDRLKIGFVKILADGSLGAHTAALKEPYSDRPETKGLMLYQQRELNRLVSKAHRAGLQLAVHAIGDYAVEAVLEAFENALDKNPRENHRHRIEHCSVLNPKLIERMKRLGLIASIQPHFTVSDFWIATRLGKDRARRTYPFKTLTDTGVVVASGSDSPVEPIDPLLGVYAAVTRKDLTKEKLTVEEALKTYTLNAAYASFDESKRGTIQIGKFADMTVLSSDLHEIPTAEIRNIKVEKTIVNGKIVYARDAA